MNHYTCEREIKEICEITRALGHPKRIKLLQLIKKYEDPSPSFLYEEMKIKSSGAFWKGLLNPLEDAELIRKAEYKPNIGRCQIACYLTPRGERALESIEILKDYLKQKNNSNKKLTIQKTEVN